MKKVDKSVLKDAANRLYFDMSDDQYEMLLEEFDTIREQFELMGKIGGVDDAIAMTFPFDVSISYLREDVPEKPLEKEDVLKNAGNVKDGQIKLPKVVG